VSWTCWRKDDLAEEFSSAFSQRTMAEEVGQMEEQLDRGGTRKWWYLYNK